MSSPKTEAIDSQQLYGKIHVIMTPCRHRSIRGCTRRGRLCVYATAAVLIFTTPICAKSLLQRLLEFTGIAATPSLQRAETQDFSGTLWVTDLERIEPVEILPEAGYRWPVFGLDDGSLFAMKGDRIVRIDLDSEPVGVEEICPDEKVVKLVGVHRSDPDKLLLLLHDPHGELVIGVLSISRASIDLVPPDSDPKQNSRLISYLRGQDREYGQTTLYVKDDDKTTMAGKMEWSEVFIKRGEEEPIKISDGDGTSCGQPSLSSDGLRVVFVQRVD